VIAAINRAEGIQAGREGRFQEAAELLDKATSSEAIKSLDPHTAEHTRRLAAKYHAAAKDNNNAGDIAPAPTVVIVDLRVRPRAGGPAQGGRVAGIMLTDDSRQGWQVLAPAHRLSADLKDGEAVAEAEVIVAAADGLSECISVQRVDLIWPEQSSQHSPLALLWLSRAIPSSPMPNKVIEEDSGLGDDGDLWETFARLGAAPDNLPNLSEEVLSGWSVAVDTARLNAPNS
jgi:hypothetical protein